MAKKDFLCNTELLISLSCEPVNKSLRNEWPMRTLFFSNWINESLAPANVKRKSRRERKKWKAFFAFVNRRFKSGASHHDVHAHVQSSWSTCVQLKVKATIAGNTPDRQEEKEGGGGVGGFPKRVAQSRAAPPSAGAPAIKIAQNGSARS